MHSIPRQTLEVLIYVYSLDPWPIQTKQVQTTLLPVMNHYFATWSVSGVQRLTSISDEITRQAMMIGYLNAFYAFCMTAFAICPFLFLAKVRRSG